MKEYFLSQHDYDDVPGTYVLDSRSYRKGYNLNMFLMTLNKSVHRDEFASNEKGYLDKFNISEEQNRLL